MKELILVLQIYKKIASLIKKGKIPISLRVKKVIGTVQDDPFDCWIEQKIRETFPKLEITHSGSLTTPDIIIRDKKDGTIVGLEVKKLIQKENGADPRGLTMDYNSCLPCGSALIKVGDETVVIKCFYLFALLDNRSKNMVTTIIMDGDFLNYDFNLHKKAKFANITEYNHGPYGEGSIRHRRMYTYPNPLNYKLPFFHLRHTFVGKKQDIVKMKEKSKATEVIVRKDIYNNTFHYLLLDLKRRAKGKKLNKLPVHKDVFVECKNRKKKDRVASMPKLTA